jgi:hypothetical protein
VQRVVVQFYRGGDVWEIVAPLTVEDSPLAAASPAAVASVYARRGGGGGSRPSPGARARAGRR